jgi:hypothetical protein
MADTKISALTQVTALATDDNFAVSDTSAGPASRRVIAEDIEKFLGVKKTTLSVEYTNNSTTGTEVTGLSFNSMPAGTYYVKWFLLYKPDATTTSPKFGVNPTGTITRMSAVFHFPSAGVTAATGTMEDLLNVTTGAVWAHLIANVASSTAPNLGPLVATTAAATHYLDVEGVIVTSTTGDIELWMGCDEAATARLQVGSSGMLMRF